MEDEENGDPYKYDGMDQATLFEIERTQDPATGKVPWNKLLIAMQETESRKAARTDAVEAVSWIERGPDGDFYGPQGNTRPNADQTAGRIRAAMVDSLDPTHKTVWVGGVDGGLWKTTDITVAPANWSLVSDFFSNLAIAAICQDPRPGFHNIMYFATGESYFNADAVRGVGVFKSTDGGTTWNFLPSTSTYVNGTRLVIDNAGNVYLGTRGSGLLRSTDGGATWTAITPTGIGADVCDLEISSTGRMHVTTGIFSTAGYRFTDNPATVTTGSWTAATTAFTTFNQRTEFAVLGNTLYACPDNASHQVPTIWKSTDGGANWASTGGQPAANWASGQGWYSLSVGINPANPDECIVGGLDCHKTTNGGTSWTKISTWVGTTGQYVHADQHNVQWWDGGTKLMFACDGGIHYSANGGTTIRDRNKGLRLKQFYSIAIHPVEVNYFLTGAQDNGMHRLNHPGLDSSIEVYGGDGCYAAIDQDEPQYQFGSYVYNVYRRTVNNGATWSTPVNNTSTGRFVNPWDYDNTANIVYACNTTGNFLRWNNPQTGGTTQVVTATGFSGNVSAVHVSPYVAHKVYFGMGTGGGVYYVSNANTGTTVTATNITPAGATGYVNCVVTGSNDQNLIACMSNYGITNIWRSTDGGTTWTASDGNLPDMPVRWALFHPDSDTKAIIATETGVWETDLLNGAATVWVPNTSFPNVRTDMIKYRASDRTIAAGTHGRGVWSGIIPPSGSGFTFNSPAPATATCPAPATMDIVLGTASVGGFTNSISLTNSTPPAGTTVSYIPSNSVTPGNSVTVRLSGTNTLAAGSYTITITGTASGAATQTRDLTFTINPGTGPSITAQPSNQTICEGGNTIFSITSAAATGFQWQLSTDGGATYGNITNGGVYSGATTATLTITGAVLAMNNNRYRCVASTQCGNTTSNAAILTVNAATAITAQPTAVSTCTGQSAQFCVTAVGTGLNYQWQSSTSCGGAFTNIAGAPNANCYTIPSVTSGMNGTAYRCVVTGGCAPASVTSNCVTLSVATSLSITGQPTDVTTCEGSNASFTVTAAGAGTYQWQVSTDGGATYNNVTNGGVYSGATAATLNITGATAAMNNYRYRCNLNSTCGNATSNVVALTVNTLPAISAGPTNVTACTGTNTSFSVTASGTGIGYQWQVSTDGGATYNSVPAAAPYSGTTSATLTITNITIGLNNYRYRCVVSGACTPAATSGAATLTVLTAVAITSNPADQTICEGSNTSFTAGATGGGLGFQWQVSTDGGATYNNVPAAAPYSGTTTATLSITAAPPSLNAYRYRCVVTNGACTPGITTGALLTVNTFPVITTAPQPVTICEGGSATFSVAATTGVGTLSYQWQVSTNGGTTWVNISGATSSSFAQTNIPLTQNGYRFRVVVTAGCGSVNSAGVILTVNALPVISFTLPHVICISDPALTLSATPAGGTFSGPGVSGSVFSPSLAGLGNKTILYTATNAGCVTAVSRSITVNKCRERNLTLEQFPAVVIYPNPNMGVFSIRINTDLYTKIGMKAYNGLGQMVWAKDYTGVTYGSILPVDMSKVPSGTYHLFIYNDELGTVSKKGASIVIYKE
ncbi:MAG: hypothetical protein JNM88_15605 [Chitinophagaceae bacterium]|nr:hypothetical protein [Chitinophagaceae bacterium]